MEILLKVIELPLWVALILPLSGVAVGIIFLAFAMLLLRGKFDAKEPKIKKSEPKAELETKSEPVSQTAETAKVAETRKPVLFPKQFYWYYVSGIPGRFATLREAISASGLTMPDKLEWRLMSSDIQDRITRVKVDDPQPDFEEQSVQPQQTVQQSAQPVVPSRPVATETDPGVITKPIGKGAFVTVKKKK